MGEVGHAHIWWHYWVIDGRLVWHNPYEPKPEDYESEGYACFCGASPPEGVPR